jgi:predicted house-cleaning noncanonical NTP pyrophosphatase (MazG superfamily)
MARKEYDKLIRDRIPEIIRADGRECGLEIMEEDEYKQALLQKVVEEAQEVLDAPLDKLIMELADLYEVIDTVMVAYDIDKQNVIDLQAKRREERGGFSDRLRLLWIE